MALVWHELVDVALGNSVLGVGREEVGEAVPSGFLVEGDGVLLEAAGVEVELGCATGGGVPFDVLHECCGDAAASGFFPTISRLTSRRSGSARSMTVPMAVLPWTARRTVRMVSGSRVSSLWPWYSGWAA